MKCDLIDDFTADLFSPEEEEKCDLAYEDQATIKPEIVEDPQLLEKVMNDETSPYTYDESSENERKDIFLVVKCERFDEIRVVVSSSKQELDITLSPIKSDEGLKYDLSDLIAKVMEKLGLDLSANCGTRVEYQVAGETVRLQAAEALDKQLLISKKDLKDKDGVMHLYLTFRNCTGNEIDFNKVTEPNSEELVESKHVFTVDGKWKELNRTRTVS